MTGRKASLVLRLIVARTRSLSTLQESGKQSKRPPIDIPQLHELANSNLSADMSAKSEMNYELCYLLSPPGHTFRKLFRVRQLLRKYSHRFDYSVPLLLFITHLFWNLIYFLLRWFTESNICLLMYRISRISTVYIIKLS